MKKLLLLFVVAGLVLAAGLSGYKLLHQTGPAAGVRSDASIVSKSSVAEVPEVSAPMLPADAPRSAVSRNVSQPEPVVQVVAAPGDCFQPVAEAQIVDQRVETVSKDQKKRELLVKAGGKYPFHRVEETLVKADGSDVYTIAARTEMVADHVLVKLQAGKTEADLRVMLQRYGLSTLFELTLPGVYRIPLKAPTLDAVPEALSIFSGESVLAYAEPDYFSFITKAPNDMSNYDLWGMVKINATGAWDTTTGSTNVVVAVIDSGIDLTHPDLVSNLWINVAEANGVAGVDDDGNGKIDDMNGWDFVNNDKTPADDHGHGTHCAGTIGAVGNNGQGVVGVCWTVRLMALKAGDGMGLLADSDVAEAIRYASDKKANIISASFGGTSTSETARDAITYASGKGVLFVAAAGNDSVNNDSVPHYPASYDIPNVVSVAATDRNDALASFSNYGKTSVDLAAPGVSIYSTIPDGKFDAMQGTSMACPHVAGAAALFLSANPTFTPLQVKEALLNTVDKLPALAAKTVSGGRLNVYNLLALKDSDGDGMPDEWEDANGLDKTVKSDATLNPDGDHLNNLNEYLNRCNPNNPDTDGDSLWDGWEVTYGFDPNSSTGSLASATSHGRFDTSGDARNVAVAGNYAYVADGDNGLVILDISNPKTPVLVSSYDTAGIAYDVAVSNGYAYVADGANGLVIVSITNKANPSLAGWTNTSGTASGVAVQSNYVYLADGESGAGKELLVFNVSNPSAPSLAWKGPALQRAMNDVYIQDGLMYVAADQNVYRMNTGTSTIGWIASPGGFTGWNMTGIHGSGSIIAAAAGANGVKIMNTNLVVLGGYDTSGTASGVFVISNYVYVADGTNGLVVLNISNPASPVISVRVPTTGSASGVCVKNGYTYVAEGTGGIEIFSILPDADGDGLDDAWELQYFGNTSQLATNDFDSDGIINWGEYLAGLNPTNSDQDADGLIDGIDEVRKYNTDPRIVDTDGDGLVDGYDGVVSTNRYAAGVDKNGDGFVDGEINAGTNPTIADTDGDGMNDGWEHRYGLNPLVPGGSGDGDNDGLTDLQESQNNTNPNSDDTDNDGMKDKWEVDNGLNPLINDSALDPDADGLTNLQEHGLRTNPKNSDSDGDSMPDGWEWTYSSSNPSNSVYVSTNSYLLHPTNSTDAVLDADGDGLINRLEYSNGCNPINIDSDGDGMPDGWEVTHGLLARAVAGTNGLNGAYGDPDGDKLLNIQEYSLATTGLWSAVYTSVTGSPSSFLFGTPFQSPGMPGSTDPQNADSDGDGLTDLYEITTHTKTNVIAGITNTVTYVTNPNNPDTDGDGFFDAWEIDNSFNPIFQEPLTIDRDGDGLGDDVEILLGTQPNNPRDPVFVDDDAALDPWPLDPQTSDPLENGTIVHPFDAIQEAINVASNGWTVLITNGTYWGEGNYNINPNGKAITIKSWNNNPDETIVNSLGYGAVFVLNSGERTNTVIKGLGITVTLSDCSDNNCDSENGITLSNASPRIENCIIYDCALDGIRGVNNSSPIVKDCTIFNVLNGIWCTGGSSPYIENCDIYNIGHIWAGDVGIGIYVDGSSGLYIGGTNTIIDRCNGRGIFIKDSVNAAVVRTMVTDSAGGMTFDNSSPRVEQCIIQNNQAPNYFIDSNNVAVVAARLFPAGLEREKDTVNEDENGGGILILRGSAPFFVNSLIVSNRTWAEDPQYKDKKMLPDYGLGGGLYIGDGCSPTGINCTVVNNHANTRGGGLSSFQSPFLRNMIFWGNTASDATISGNTRLVFSNSTYRNLHCRSGSINIWYSDIQYGYPTAVLSSTNNPLFISNENYHLASTNSPCYNSGTFALAPTNDLDGNPRPIALPQRVDMGCYEGVGSGSGGSGGGALANSDSDGLPDIYEYNLGSSNLWASVYTNVIGAPATFFFGSPLGTPGMPGSTDPANPDSDGDGLSDLYEITTNAAITNLFITNPNKADTDGDGLPDGWEVKYGRSPISTNGVDGASGDPDVDGLTNSNEYTLGTSPILRDTDGDGLDDDVEVSLGTSPINGHDPVYVDDNAETDPMKGEPNISNTNENGSITYPFDSIQEAIDWTNTVNGMTVLVTNGTYEGTGNFNINPRGKSIQILSVNGSTNTFIKTHAYGSAFVINSGETTNTLIRGFTIETYGDLAPEEGVVVSGASPVLQDLVIHNCELEAVSCLNGAAPRILNSRFYNVPHGLYADGSAGVLLQQCVISNTSSRGVVIMNDDLAAVTWSTIEDCRGGITLDNSDASIRQCTVRNNNAPNYYTIDGSLWSAPVQFNLTASNYVDTTSSDENGAGILMLNASSPLLQNCLITGNRTWADDPDYSRTVGWSSFGLGAGIYISSGCNPTGVNCTIVNNHANTRGGGVSSAGRPLFRNMIIWDNTAANARIDLTSPTNEALSRYTSPGSSSIDLVDEVVNIWYSDIEGGYANAVLCMDSDPLFVGGTNYSLQSTSPCRTNGTYYLAPLVDIAGNLRPTFTDYPARVDMGCYQYGASASTNPIALGAELALGAEDDPLADTDGDGFSNGDELIAGTDSYNENDYFRVSHQQSQADGSVLVAWASIQGSLYTVQSTDSLTGTWTNESGYVSLAGTGGVMTFSGSLPTGSRFYRVLVRQP